MLPPNIRVDMNCQPTWVTQNAIPDKQELILLRGGHYDPLPDKVGLMEWTSLTLLPFLKKSKIYIQNLDDILGSANLRFFRKG